jgi:cbb3-type cytochrome oxidase subunit 3
MYLKKREDIFSSNIQWTATHMLKNLHKHRQIPVDSDRAQAWFTIQIILIRILCNLLSSFWTGNKKERERKIYMPSYLKLPQRRPRKYIDCSMSLPYTQQKQLLHNWNFIISFSEILYLYVHFFTSLYWKLKVILKP